MRGARGFFAVLGASLVGGALAAGAGCSTSTSRAAGLEVVLATDLKTPDDFDRFELDVRQETSPGTYAPLFEKDFLLPQEATLPTTFGVGPGTGPDQNALVRVIAKKGATAVILREALVQVPHDRVATLTMVLAAACRGQVATVAGLAQSTCANPLVESCQPSTGRCGATSLDAASLPTYSPGDESRVDAGTGSVTDAAAKDAAAPPDATSDTTLDGAAPADASIDAADTSDSGCAAGSISCQGGCVSASDVHTCGSCTNDCTQLPQVHGSVTCGAGGVCAFAPSACDPGWADCDGQPGTGCEANLSLGTHCGACTTVCSGGTPNCSVPSASVPGSSYACVSGCPAGQQLCNGTCTTVAGDPLHCGTCANACTTSVVGAQASCANSACGFTCGSYTACGNACVNLTNDLANCGACGTACPTGATCSNRTCACPGGTVTCGAACLNVQGSDASNCGACGHACIGGTCSAGVCQPWAIATLAGSTSVQLAVDGTYAAFGASPHGVQVVPVAGAAGGLTPRTLTSTSASAVTLASGNVIWATNDGSSSPSTTLSFAPAASGAATTTPTIGFANGGVFSLAVNAAGTQVYLLDNGSDAATVNVYACTPVSASASCSQVGSFAIPSPILSPPTSTAYSFIGTNQFVFYGASSALGRFGLTSGAKSSVTGQGPTVQSVAVDTTSVYWLNSGNNASTTTLSVSSAPLALGSSKTLVSGIPAGLYFGAFAGEIAVDGSNVYLAVLNSTATTSGGMYLASVPKAGGPLSAPLYATPNLITGLAAVNGALYWAEIVNNDVNPVATVYGLRLP